MLAPPKPALDAHGLAHLLVVQDGVVSRRQILELGGSDHDIARMLRRRDLAPVHRGVYVNHTGAPSRRQQEWAAVLFYWPAALTRESALPASARTGPIHVAVALGRRVSRLPGVRVHTTVAFDGRVGWNHSPPRLQYADAVVEVAARLAAAAATDPAQTAEAFRVLADATQTRKTTATALAANARSRSRLPGRGLLLGLLTDLETGACSVLERGYLELERRHGLPTENRRQTPARANGRRAYRDVDHSDFGALVELDGRPYHDDATSRDLDAGRDLEAAVEDDVHTVRLTYGLVFRGGCTTIRRVATLIERGGWPGPFLPCPDCPPEPATDK